MGKESGPSAFREAGGDSRHCAASSFTKKDRGRAAIAGEAHLGSFGDLWTTFNRVQKNMTKRGVYGRSRTGRRVKTRAINGIDQNVKVNRALWVLAEENAEAPSLTAQPGRGASRAPTAYCSRLSISNFAGTYNPSRQLIQLRCTYTPRHKA